MHAQGIKTHEYSQYAIVITLQTDDSVHGKLFKAHTGNH